MKLAISMPAFCSCDASRASIAPSSESPGECRKSSEVSKGYPRKTAVVGAVVAAKNMARQLIFGPHQPLNRRGASAVGLEGLKKEPG